MYSRKYISLALAAILIGSSAISCAPRLNNQTSVQSSEQPAADVDPVELKALEAPVYGKENQTAMNAASGANEFSWRFSQELLKSNNSDNFICSPYSVWLSLAALLNATNEENKQVLLAALSMEGITEEDVNSAASRMLYDLTKEREQQDYPGSHDPLKIANVILVDQKETLKKEFVLTFADFYRGHAMKVDFADKSAANAVNQWASDNTEGFITNIVEELNPGTVAAIANAIYFADRWDWEFKPENTTENVFHSPSGNTTAQFMLREADELTYYEDDQIQAMPLQFKTGGELYILLPKSGDAAELLNSMDNTYFQEIVNESVSATGKLLLPRFKIESGMISLEDTLTALGVPLFDENSAPLKGGLIERDVPVYLSTAVQKAVIEVDEKGTTAAAVTILEDTAASESIPTAPFLMVCDKPFVFILTDHTYDGGSQILFTGIVGNPESN